MTKKEKDWDAIAKIERAIEERYGPHALIDPRSSWTEEKEKEYLREMKACYGSMDSHTERINENGVLIPKELIIEENTRVCLACNSYSFQRKDDLYLNKFRCCFKCYIMIVEDREEKWFAKLRDLEEDKCQ